MRARRRRRSGPRFGRTRQGRRRERARRRRRRRRRARGGTPREDRARARRGARRVEPRRRPRRVGTAATSRRTRHAETNAREVGAPSRARARRARASRAPRAVATRTTRATTSSPSSPSASRAWACAVARIFAADREGRQLTEMTARNAALARSEFSSGYAFANMGLFFRALGGFAVPRPHRRPGQGLFPFFSGAARAERAPHVRRPRTGSPERAHFHPSRTPPFAMGKDKSKKDVGAAQVRAPPLERSPPLRHRPPPFPTNISGAQF